MRPHAYRPRRRIDIAGESLGIAELALGVALGFALAVGTWIAIVVAVAIFGEPPA